MGVASVLESDEGSDSQIKVTPRRLEPSGVVAELVSELDMNKATPIPGYPGYFLTRTGEVWSNRRGSMRRLHSQTNRDGYQSVTFSVDGRSVGRLLHRLMLTTFVGEPPTDQHVTRHLNGDRADNRLSNLAWGTQAENITDALGHGTMHQMQRRGELVPSAKLLEDDVRQIEQRARSGAETVKSIAHEFGVSRSLVSKIRDHARWQHLWA